MGGVSLHPPARSIRAGALAIAASPIMPTAAEKLWKMLGYPHPLSTYAFNDIVDAAVPVTNKLPEPTVLFQKVENELIEQKEAALKNPAPQKKNAFKKFFF